MDIRLGPGSSSPEHLVAVGDVLYFSAHDEHHRREPWVLHAPPPKPYSISGLVFVDFIRGQKLEEQVMATALAVYVTNQSLAGTAGQAYGFQVSTYGVGTRTYNVGSCGAAFGVEDDTELTVLDLLRATDAMTLDGVLYYSDNLSLTRALRSMANEVYSDINR